MGTRKRSEKKGEAGEKRGLGIKKVEEEGKTSRRRINLGKTERKMR